MVEQIGIYRTARLRFPGRAGELQRQGASASLARELGDGYASYHRHLRDELARYGGRPKPEDYSDQQTYFDVCAHAQEIVIAEALLRACAAYRRSGRPLDAPLDTSTPLLDSEDRLVAAFPLDDEAASA